MKILVAHNRYQQLGGEDVVFESEVRLLQEAGHSVTTLTEDNRRIDRLSRLSTGFSRTGMTTTSTPCERMFVFNARSRRPRGSACAETRLSVRSIGTTA